MTHAEVCPKTSGAEANDTKQAPHGGLEGKAGRIWSYIVLIAVTFLIFALMVGLLWSPAGSSLTKLGDSSVYVRAVLTSFLVACSALALMRLNRYAGRLALIGLVGLIVLLLGWALRSA